MPTEAPPRAASRRPSRRGAILEAAARLFDERGYHGTSIRDIAEATGVTPGAIYSHSASKADLLLAVYEEGVRRIEAKVERAVAGGTSARERLGMAAEAHLETLLDGSAFAAVVIRVLPRDVPEMEDRLTRLRDGYEARFTQLIDDLPGLGSGRRRALRLALLGALNGTQAWYRPGREHGPREIARGTVSLLLGEGEDG